MTSAVLEPASVAARCCHGRGAAAAGGPVAGPALSCSVIGRCRDPGYPEGFVDVGVGVGIPGCVGVGMGGDGEGPPCLHWPGGRPEQSVLPPWFWVWSWWCWGLGSVPKGFHLVPSLLTGRKFSTGRVLKFCMKNWCQM